MAGKLTWQDVLVSVLGHIFRFPSVLAFTNVLSILILFLQPLQVTGKTVIIFTIITATTIIIIIKSTEPITSFSTHILGSRSGHPASFV